MSLEGEQPVGAEHDEHASGLQETVHLRQSADFIGRVFEHFVEQDEVEAAVGQRHRRQLALCHALRHRVARVISADFLGGKFDTPRVGAARGERLHVFACAAAGIEQPSAAKASERFDQRDAFGEVERGGGVAACDVHAVGRRAAAAREGGGANRGVHGFLGRRHRWHFRTATLRW